MWKMASIKYLNEDTKAACKHVLNIYRPLICVLNQIKTLGGNAYSNANCPSLAVIMMVDSGAYTPA
ncbi:MAG TPA: hypothetical protein PK856_03900, partial [Vitreoscilla sp.]|nr:hypothetical protein [Vitreoscilla sp.]